MAKREATQQFLGTIHHDANSFAIPAEMSVLEQNIPRSAVSLGSRPTCTILFLRPVSNERFSKSRRVMFSRSSCSQGTIFTSFSTISISTCISRKRKIHNPFKLGFVFKVKALSVCYRFTCKHAQTCDLYPQQ